MRIQHPACGMIASGGEVTDVVGMEAAGTAGAVDEVEAAECGSEDGFV